MLILLLLIFILGQKLLGVEYFMLIQVEEFMLIQFMDISKLYTSSIYRLRETSMGA